LRVVKEVNVAGRRFKLHLDMEDATSQPVIFQTGRWEPRITAFLLENLKQDMIFIDYLSSSGNGFKINVPIDMVTLDSYLKMRGVEKVDMVKIDVEGSELRVLKGMEQTIRNSGKIKIICEVHLPYLNRYGDNINQLFEYTQTMDLRKQRLTGGKTAQAPRYLFYKEE